MRSSFGRALKAIRTDQTAAAALGINVVRYKLAAFAISAALASLVRQPLCVLLPFSVARNGQHVALAGDDHDAGHRRRRNAGRIAGRRRAADAAAEIFQPFALYKRLAEGALLVLAFQYLPAGIFGSLAGWLSRLGDGARAAAAAGLFLSKDKSR